MNPDEIDPSETRRHVSSDRGKSTLFVFTINYPFGSGETYLHAELIYHSQSFERIVIQPMSGQGPVRELPQNVETLKPLWGNHKERLFFLIRGLFSLHALRLAVSCTAAAIIELGGIHVAKTSRIVLYSIYRSALERSASLNGHLDNAIAPVAYCYWGHVPALAVPLLHRKSIPTIVRYHRVDLYEHAMKHSTWLNRNGHFFPWRREIIDKADAHVFVSEHGMEYFRAKWAKSVANKLHLFRLGTSDPGEPARRQAATTVFTIVSCSNIIPVKRVPRIAMFCQALSDLVPVRWIHFGTGDELELRELLERGRSVHPNLTCELRGRVPNEEVLSYLNCNSIDLFVNFSVSEGLPVSIMEALSADIPVLATDVDGTSEAVIVGRSGYLCSVDEPDDPYTLAHRVFKLVAGNEFKKLTPRTVWKERFSASTNYSSFTSFLRDHAKVAEKGDAQL